MISEAIAKNNCLKKDGLYLCNSNYYQKEFLQISDLLNAKIDREVITRYLFDKIKANIIDFGDDIKYIAITSSSHKILDSLVNQRKIQKNDCIYFDNYVDFEIDSKVNEISEKFRYILICDTISTGSITKRVDEILKNRKAKLIAIGVLVNTLDETYDNCREFLKEFEKRLIFLYKHPIKKEKREDLINIDYSPIRINPFTNIPITLSEDLTIKKSILLSNIDFLDCIDSTDISIKFKIFNNIIHPYFFEFKSILENENKKVHTGNNNSLIHKIFTKLEKEYNFNFAENNYSIFYPKNSDIQFLDIEILKNNIFYNESIEYFQLERFSTDSGWKFPHTTEYFKEKIIEKPNVMILDDGSCSGDSLLQMINELSYFEPQKIDLICIIGRIDDHKREFFSKISKFKSSSNKEIDVNIYFGTHWHIPTFYQDNNPYSHEIGWVKKLKELQNTPSRIKNYAITIKEEIEPHANKSNEYKYFPIDKKTDKIPKKEILFVRNEIGKIIGYRYYKESFIWFNNLIKNTQNNVGYFDKKCNKDIEELIMCFLYEPYLYEKVILTIPDVKEIIENFIKKIIFRNTKDENQKILYYNWDKNYADFVHLFFIVFNDKKLMYYFDLDKFRKLIDFIGEKKINYILYKLLYYSEFNVNQDGVIFNEIKRIIDTYLQDGNGNKSVKLFRYYISSLPYKDDFDDRLSHIFNQYRLINDARHHKEAITIKIENVLSYLDILSVQYDLDLYNNLKENINPILDLIQQILSFSSAYPSYFSKYINLFETDNDSLRLLHKDLSRGISFMTKNSDFQHLISTIKKLRDNFFGINSVPYKIFFNHSTENFIDTLTEFVDNNSSNNDFVVEGELINISIYFPKLITLFN